MCSCLYSKCMHGFILSSTKHKLKRTFNNIVRSFKLYTYTVKKEITVEGITLRIYITEALAMYIGTSNTCYPSL